MRRTTKRCEFYAPRYYEKAGRWHHRNIYVNKAGEEYVKVFGEFVSVETLKDSDLVKEFHYV